MTRRTTTTSWTNWQPKQPTYVPEQSLPERARLSICDQINRRGGDRLQRDRVVASFTLLAAVGRLSPRVLGLRMPVYDANVHYQQVRNTWAGVRTPNER